MRFSWLSRSTVDGQDVLRTRRERYDEIHLRLQGHVRARLRNWLIPRQDPLDGPWNMHEQIQGTWSRRRRKPQFSQGSGEVVRAIIMVLGTSEQLVPRIIASRHQRVVYAPRSVLDEGEDGAALICHQRIPYAGA